MFVYSINKIDVRAIPVREKKITVYRPAVLPREFIFEINTGTGVENRHAVGGGETTLGIRLPFFRLARMFTVYSYR